MVLHVVSAPTLGVVSGELSSVIAPICHWECAVVVVWPRTSVEEVLKSTIVGCERTSGWCCVKNWCRHRSGAFSGRWDIWTIVGSAASGGAVVCSVGDERRERVVWRDHWAGTRRRRRPVGR